MRRYILLSLLPLGFESPAFSATLESERVFASTASALNSSGIFFSSHVKISQGGDLVFQGAAAYLTSNSSIGAQGLTSFWGDGGGLKGVVGLSTPTTISAAVTFQSSLTVTSSGERIVLSTSNSSANIQISPQGEISFHPALHNTSSTIVDEFTTSATNFAECIPSSELKLNTSGGRVEVGFSGALDLASSSTVKPMISFYQDGQFVQGLDPTAGITNISQHKNNADSNVNSLMVTFSYLIDAPPKGLHTYCLTIASIDVANSRLVNDGEKAGIFWVKELK